MKKIIMILLMGQSLYAYSKEAKLDKDKIFEHPKISEVCLSDNECKVEAKQVCKSEDAKVESCSEQYKGNWITSCKCK